MLTILRVTTRRTQLDRLLNAVSLRPYRVEDAPNKSADIVYLHYQLFDSNAPFAEELLKIETWLVANEADLKEFSAAECETVLDIGAFLYENEYASFLDINTNFMKLLVQYDIDLALSVYMTSQPDDVD